MRPGRQELFVDSPTQTTEVSRSLQRWYRLARRASPLHCVLGWGYYPFLRARLSKARCDRLLFVAEELNRIDIQSLPRGYQASRHRNGRQ